MLQGNNRTEFKAVLNDKLEKEIVAFLNNREGGILYIGLDDNGHPVGVEDPDDVQLKIADRIKNNILPSTMGLFDICTQKEYTQHCVIFLRRGRICPLLSFGFTMRRMVWH